MMRMQRIQRIAPSTVQVHCLRVHSSTRGRCDPPDPPNPLDRSSLLLSLLLPFGVRERKPALRCAMWHIILRHMAGKEE